ncbi:MAG: ABC transporter ATP-binding protein/permease [Oscillospiraceae bacterium]|nr:ABC transporter ATP-binding protein/permease [Oscillospiraceae bacterium]
MSVLKKLLHIFNRQIKIRLFILLIAIIAGALIEIAALSVMSPFIAVLLDSSHIDGGGTLNFIYDMFGFGSHNAFLAFMAFVLAGIYVSRGFYIFFLGMIQYRFLSKRQIELSDRLLAIILDKPYLYHTNKNLSELNRIISGDVTSLIGLLQTILAFLSDIFMSFFVFIFLVLLSPPMTFGMVGLASLCMIIYYRIFRKKIKVTGEEVRNKSIRMSKAIIQALGGIKELKVLGRENYFIKEYKNNADGYVKLNQRYQVYSSIPRVLIETICFGGAFVLIGAFIASGMNMTNIVPQLSIFVLASFRILPAISRFAGYLNSIIFLKPSVDAVHTGIFNQTDYTVDIISRANEVNDSAGSDIYVENITFQYPKAPEAVLENVSLCIPYKKSTAFVGPTGAGKTTLADIILGIYMPQSGNIFYEGKSIYNNLGEWTKQIGYIPQRIYLIDESIRENVAFGVPREDIDEARVWQAVKQAQLAEFVNTFPDKLDAIVGDRGVRLSGGQRQRIGIARALYNDPSVLVLDEATSSLDTETEKAVMDAIKSLKGEKTMIIIAHRLSTIEHCDIIYRVADKSVIEETT